MPAATTAFAGVSQNGIFSTVSLFLAMDITAEKATALLKNAKISDEDMEKCLSGLTRRTTVFGLVKVKESKDAAQGKGGQGKGDSGPRFGYAQSSCPNLLRVLVKFVSDAAKKQRQQKHCPQKFASYPEGGCFFPYFASCAV